MKTLIKRDDMVVVNSGRSKGSRGRVLRVYPETDRALVEGVNLVTKATKPDPRMNQPGGFVKKEGTVHISNLLLYCSTCDRGVRAKKIEGAGGKPQRVCARCRGVIGKGK
jgi:large subunit ribosomal protein L24